MFDAAQLVLLIGPAPAPLPAPLPVMEAILSVEVTGGRDRSGFQLKLALGKTSPLQLAMLPLGFFDPVVTRVVIAVVFRGLPKVLMDGIVTRQELQPGDRPGESALTLTGEDVSVLMDLVELRIPYPAMPDAARVATILARYAAFGVVPAVVPPPVVNADTPTERFDTQNCTDRAYLRELAAQSGYVFFIEPGPLPGQSFGYFGPDYRLPIPQPALSVDMDSETNVEQFGFSLEGLAKKTTVMLIYDPATHKVPVPIVVPAANPLHLPLGARPNIPARVGFAEDTARLTPAEAAKRALGIAMQNADAVSGQGTLDVAAYGAILSPRMLVGVRGAGLTYDGFYYVDSVTHSLKPGEYKQRFQLSRDGMVSNTPVVVP
ncbi:hypothetical protein [Sphingomonas sp.]|uniref:hypothetical protein n=1 Tax=Sphingomonas sp. TaxID=28214 RepID=UPI0035BC1833